MICVEVEFATGATFVPKETVQAGDTGKFVPLIVTAFVPKTLPSVGLKPLAKKNEMEASPTANTQAWHVKGFPEAWAENVCAPLEPDGEVNVNVEPTPAATFPCGLVIDW